MSREVELNVQDQIQEIDNTIKRRIMEARLTASLVSPAKLGDVTKHQLTTALATYALAVTLLQYFSQMDLRMCKETIDRLPSDIPTPSIVDQLIEISTFIDEKISETP